MDLKNIISAVSLSLAIIILYQLFLAPTPEEINKARTEKELVKTSEAPKVEEKIIIETASREDAIKSSKRVYFENEFIKGSIALTGGMIDDFEFKKYDKSLNSEDKVKLLNPISTKEGYLFNTGWATNSDISTPKPDTIWNVDGNNKLTPNNPIKIYFENDQGIRFERLISLDKKYLFNVKQTLINKSDKSYRFYPYAIIHRNNVPDDLTDFYILHEGFVTVTDTDDIKEHDYSDIFEKKYSQESSTGYLSIGDKYWMTSILPQQGRKFRFDIDYNKKYRASYIDLEGYESKPNSTTEHSIQSLIGAKEIKLINEYAESLNIEKLDLIINYGILYFIVKILWFALDYCFTLTGNFGYAIILVTILVRILFFPLNQFSMKSMGKMKSLGPQLEIIKARYKEDKQQMQKEIMKIYKANGVNPAASCFPVLVQIPIFFSLYKLLLLDVAMRHAPWIWIWQDLSAKDPTSIFNLFGLLPYQVPTILEIGILPVLMGITMFLQMRLSPSPGGSGEMEKMQKKIFMFMPLFLTVLLAPFAAGLVLYWVATNCLTIIQQYIINRTINVKK